MKNGKGKMDGGKNGRTVRVLIVGGLVRDVLTSWVISMGLSIWRNICE